MPVQVLINLLIAWLWMFLHDSWSSVTFISGYIVGIIVLLFIHRFFKQPFYIFMVIAIVKLVLLFMQELFSSSVLVIKQILNPKLDVQPGFFRLDVDVEGDIEVTLLAMLITLTPGSCVMEVTPDQKAMYIHAMDVRDVMDAVVSSQKRFEKAIKDVTRKNV